MTETVHVPQSCILFATADWDEPYWTNKQHCAQSLADLGTRVLYVESVGLRSPRANSKRDWKRLKARLVKGIKCLIFGATQRAPGIFVLSPLGVPGGHHHRVFRHLNRFLLRISVARSLMRTNFQRPILWTYHPFMLDLIRGTDFGPLLYHCVDDLTAVPGVNATGFRTAENELLSRADVVFVTAPLLADRCRSINPNTHFLPNVVDVTHFGKALMEGMIPEDLANIPEPRLGYHGVLSDFKLDIELLVKCVALKPDWHWVFIGEEPEGQNSKILAKLAQMDNVHFLGYRPYEVLPSYLRGFNVGLLPTRLNQYTRSMFPMKYYEYLAAGLPVAATPLEFTGECTLALKTGKTAEDFCAAISILLNAGKFGPDEAIELVGKNTWKRRTLAMLDTLYKGISK